MKNGKATIRLPRPVKVFIYIVSIIILAVTYSIALGCPTLSLRQELRRIEKAHLVGPSTIVDIVHRTEYGDFDKLLVGETAHGICFLGKHPRIPTNRFILTGNKYSFTYIPKTGEITVAPAPNISGVFWNLKGETLPVYVFTSVENAVRAEIEITVQGEMSNPDPNYSYNVFYNETIKAESTRKISGAFRFMLKGSTNTESHALAQFSTIYSNSLSVPLVETNFPIPVIVRLYDSNNKLIAEEQFTMGS